MAKTTKTTKRTVSTKKRGLLSKINFSSKKTQFVAVIAIVAIMGGGWFTYRSFAAYVFYDVSADRGSMWCDSPRPLCTQIPDTQKNGRDVFALRYGGSARGKALSSLVKGRPYNMCIWAKGNGTVNLHITTWQYGRFNVNKTDNFNRYCTGYKTNPYSLKNPSVFATHILGNEVRVSSIQIEY